MVKHFVYDSCFAFLHDADDDQSKGTGPSFQKEKSGNANDVLWKRLLWNASTKVSWCVLFAQCTITIYINLLEHQYLTLTDTMKL